MNQYINKKITRQILLNPGPATTSEQVKSSMVVADICPRENSFGETLVNIRSKLLKVVNASEAEFETVLIGGSGTAAIEAALSTSTSDDRSILILENGAYGERMRSICNTLNIEAETLSFDWEKPIDLIKVKNHLQAHSKKYRVMAFIHHETTTGILNPLEELFELAKNFELATMVDAMSSFAGIPIDYNKTPVDYLISSSNKCIQGMAGIGIVIVKKAELEQIKTHPKRSFYLDLYNNFVNQKNKKQFLFTPPVQILYALEAAIAEFFEEGGISERAGRYVALYNIMYNGLTSMGFTALIAPAHHSKILTTFKEPTDPNYNFEKMHDFLFERGITIYPGKIDSRSTFRISNLGALTEADIYFFLSAMKDYLEHAQVEYNHI